MTPRTTSIYLQRIASRLNLTRGVEAPVKSISLRLPREMLNDLKVLANKKDVPYQSLIKVYLAEIINEERKKKRDELS